MTHTSPIKHAAPPNAQQPGPAAEAPELHHGDLRKAAYLKRRADYQMQAHAPSNAQAGTLPTGSQAQPGRRSG